jgi:molybdopterin-dependent oxidoreductase alpha subunit
VGEKSKRINTKRGGGWKAVQYPVKMARASGSPLKFAKALRKSNVCKACALGMKGMKNELGEGFQICKKAMQAISQDLRPGIPKEVWSHSSLNDLKNLSGRELEAMGRLVHPLYRESNDEYFQPVSWDFAFEKLVEKFKAADPNRTFFYTSGRSSNEAAFLIQIFARQFGTNHINNCSYYCHQASGVGLGATFGSGTGSLELEDVEKSDLVVLIGCNPSSNHPRFMTHLMNLKKRKGHVIVVNPLREIGLTRFGIPSEIPSLLFTTDIADDYFQPHCGGDLAFIKAVTAYIMQNGKANEQFLKNYTNGYEEFKQDLLITDIDELTKFSGISMKQLETFVEYLLNAENVIFAWAMGITHHLHGSETVRAIANLSLVLGMVGKPGAGMLPLRGHSNVQGVGTVGVVPKLKPEMVKAITQELNVEIPQMDGYDTFTAMQAAYDGKVSLAFLLGGNLFSANPDSKWAKKALNNIDFTFQLSTTLNKGHLFGQGKSCLILPVRTRDEEQQITTQESMFSFVRYSVGGSKPPIEDLPSESQIIGYLGKQLFDNEPVPWERFANHDVIREYIAKIVPGLQKIKNVKEEEFTIDGRIFHEPKFATIDGKANLSILVAPDVTPPEGWFNLTSIRSEGQFNTIVYEDEDLYRGVRHRQIVFINPIDLEMLGLSDGDWVHVKSEIGELYVEAVAFDIRPRNVAMYYPEANDIIPGEVDKYSKTPAFKRSLVQIISK